MNDRASGTLMKRLTVEFTVLAAIVAGTMLLMNVRVHERYIEDRRAILRYEADVDKSTALHLMQALSDSGVIGGNDLAFALGRADDTWEFHAVALPETLESPQKQQQLRELFRPICRRVFGDGRVHVRLTDDELNPVVLLLVQNPVDAAP